MKPSRSSLCLIATVLSGVLLASCSSGSSGPDQEASTPSPERSSADASSLECPEQAEAFDDPDKRHLIGDLDGDGEPDRSVLALPVDDCPAAVLAEVRGSVSAAPIEEETSGPGLPGLAGLVDIDGVGGAEVVVAIAAGASTEFFGVFVWRGGNLERIEVPGGRFGSLFPSGGSAGHLDASDCAEEGELVISSAVPGGGRFDVERRFYELDSGDLRPAGRQRARVPFDRIDRFEEFSTTPFGACPPA